MCDLAEAALQDLDIDGARDMKAKMEELLSHPAWKHISNTIRFHYHRQMADMLATPLESVDAALKQEYTKGNLAAYLTLWSMPETMIAFFDSVINTRTE